MGRTLCDIKPGLKKKGARTWETKEGRATLVVPRQQELYAGKRILNRQKLERKCQPEGRHGRHCDGGVLPLAPLLLLLLLLPLVQPLQEKGGDGGASAHLTSLEVSGEVACLLTCLLITPAARPRHPRSKKAFPRIDCSRSKLVRFSKV